jgi:hypothetical protein
MKWFGIAIAFLLLVSTLSLAFFVIPSVKADTFPAAGTPTWGLSAADNSKAPRIAILGRRSSRICNDPSR